MPNKNDKKLIMSPITFKITYGMLELLEEIIKSGEYLNRAELIRDAIQYLLNYESKLKSLNQN